jgi:hypothetical protein
MEIEVVCILILNSGIIVVAKLLLEFKNLFIVMSNSLYIISFCGVIWIHIDADIAKHNLQSFNKSWAHPRNQRCCIKKHSKNNYNGHTNCHAFGSIPQGMFSSNEKKNQCT